MAKIFIDYFDIKQRKPDDFVNYEKIKQDVLKLKIDIDVDLFDEDSAIIFITLLKPMGYIKRLTSTFFKVFGLPNEQVLN